MVFTATNPTITKTPHPKKKKKSILESHIIIKKTKPHPECSAE